MDNVYDYINDFYTNDDGWNMVIPRDDVETYIRKCAWQGMDDKALQKEWDNLSIFCIYLENDMLELQDVTEEILVGCVICLYDGTRRSHERPGAAPCSENPFK